MNTPVGAVRPVERTPGTRRARSDPEEDDHQTVAGPSGETTTTKLPVARRLSPSAPPAVGSASPSPRTFRARFPCKARALRRSSGALLLWSARAGGAESRRRTPGPDEQRDRRSRPLLLDESSTTRPRDRRVAREWNGRFALATSARRGPPSGQLRCNRTPKIACSVLPVRPAR